MSIPTWSQSPKLETEPASAGQIKCSWQKKWSKASALLYGVSEWGKAEVFEERPGFCTATLGPQMKGYRHTGLLQVQVVSWGQEAMDTKYRKIHLNTGKNLLLRRWSSTRLGCPERLWSSHPWRYSNLYWTLLWVLSLPGRSLSRGLDWVIPRGASTFLRFSEIEKLNMLNCPTCGRMFQNTNISP